MGYVSKPAKAKDIEFYQLISWARIVSALTKMAAPLLMWGEKGRFDCRKL